MANVSAQIRLPAPATEIWDRIGDFNAVPSWHPAIEDSTLEEGGRVRRVTVAADGQSVERLIAHDDAARRYSYTLVEGPMPVSAYRATLAVDDDPGGGSCVTWSAQFTAAGASDTEAGNVISSFLHAGLDNLKELYP